MPQMFSTLKADVDHFFARNVTSIVMRRDVNQTKANVEAQLDLRAPPPKAIARESLMMLAS